MGSKSVVAYRQNLHTQRNDEPIKLKDLIPDTTLVCGDPIAIGNSIVSRSNNTPGFSVFGKPAESPNKIS